MSRSSPRRVALLVAVVPAAVLPALAVPRQSAAAAPRPQVESWRLEKALGLPDWLHISGQQRTRFETLDGQFRAAAGLDDTDHAWALRTNVLAEAQVERFVAALEVIDSRHLDTDDGSFVDASHVNTAELLQGYVGYRTAGLFTSGDQATILFGRHTMDVGSRRLVARNDFRNTINAFLGVNSVWESDSGDAVRAFFVLPTRRQPGARDELLDNDSEFDDENRHQKFWGVSASFADVFEKVTGELYYFGLDEQDSKGLATANRALTTVGGRLVKKPAKEVFDFEVEAAYQFGDSRSSTTSNTDLEHSAEFVHLEGGYTFDHEWKPRGVLQFDYASGDDSPSDDENNRFDTLFGARRWEFGPTGILGVIARANVMTPGLRFILKPRSDIELMLSHRPVYLASDTDTYTPGGVRDSTGGSGDHVGDFTEARVRWNVLPGSWALEFGAAYMANGEFLDGAPNASGNGDTSYAYVQSQLSF